MTNASRQPPSSFQSRKRHAPKPHPLPTRPCAAAADSPLTAQPSSPSQTRRGAWRHPMASIAPLPPTPQQAPPMAQMAPPPAGSPVSAHPQYAPPSHAPSPYAHAHGYNMSFDSPQHAIHSQPSYAHSFSQSFPNGPVSGAGYSRSFAEPQYAASTGQQRSFDGKPQIYTVRLLAQLVEVYAG